jgi:hypothetical protein
MTIRHFLGLDLGQRQDYTALAVLEQTSLPDPARPGYTFNTYAARTLKRWPLGTAYHTIIDDLARSMRLTALTRPCLAIDATEVGVAVEEQVYRAGLPCQVTEVTITTGSRMTGVPRGVRVPKKDLVGVLEVLLGSSRLKIATSLPDAETLLEELRTFRAKITLAGNETFSAWRERDHDDLVLAAALAAWLGENKVEPYPGPPVLNDWAQKCWHGPSPEPTVSHVAKRPSWEPATPKK